MIHVVKKEKDMLNKISQVQLTQNLKSGAFVKLFSNIQSKDIGKGCLSSKYILIVCVSGR